uniref:Uncharacterized protein n=1 Tax=Kalanchoe fedtschenkoi TaxID=63787 RepID=A0A7N0V623_KALFE
MKMMRRMPMMLKKLCSMKKTNQTSAVMMMKRMASSILIFGGMIRVGKQRMLLAVYREGLNAANRARRCIGTKGTYHSAPAVLWPF